MSKDIINFTQSEIARLLEGKEVDNFRVGDTVKVQVIDKTTDRLQSVEGVVISKSNKNVATNFVVRRVKSGFGIERLFMLYSPLVKSVKVLKFGKVRRNKLYYLRNLSGKSARIPERKIYKKQA